MGAKEHYALAVVGLIGLAMIGYGVNGLNGMLSTTGWGILFYVLGRLTSKDKELK